MSLGHLGGILSCTVECELDLSECEQVVTCGNGALDPEEICDGSELDGLTCGSLFGQAHGELRCTTDCYIDPSDCHTCGDAVAQGPEQCDVHLQGRDCVSEGYSGGELACSSACELDHAACWVCGDSVCDSLKGETREDCPEDCGWIDLSAGRQHTCAVAGDGRVFCWGRNDDGQLGDGDFVNNFEPMPVVGIQGAVAVSAGDRHTCALLSDGRAWCWGGNEHGQLGVGDTVTNALPAEVSGLSDVTSISLGGEHTCAVASQLLWCWGRNDLRQLGDTSSTDRPLPMPVSTSTGLSLGQVIDAGLGHSCSIADDNTAWCWGNNARGMLGDGSLLSQAVPVSVSTGTGLLTVTQLVAANSHTCAISPMGAVWCWGDNSDGRLGDGTLTGRRSPRPVLSVSGLQVATNVAVGDAHTCAVDLDGAAWCWGLNSFGALGDGSQTNRELPVLVSRTSGMASALEVTAGESHSCALGIDSSAWCWGANGAGQLGDGTVTVRSLPVEVPGY